MENVRHFRSPSNSSRTRLSSPKFFAGNSRALGHGLQLRPHDRGVYSPVELLLREAAIRAGDDVLAADQPRELEDAFGNKLRMLDHVGAVADNAGRQHLAVGQLNVLPDTPFVLVARISRLNEIGARPDLENKIDYLLEGNVGRVRSRPTDPAN